MDEDARDAGIPSGELEDSPLGDAKDLPGARATVVHHGDERRTTAARGEGEGDVGVEPVLVAGVSARQRPAVRAAEVSDAQAAEALGGDGPAEIGEHRDQCGVAGVASRSRAELLKALAAARQAFAADEAPGGGASDGARRGGRRFDLGRALAVCRPAEDGQEQRREDGGPDTAGAVWTTHGLPVPLAAGWGNALGIWRSRVEALARRSGTPDDAAGRGA